MNGQNLNGDFALYLFMHDEEVATDDTPVFRYVSVDEAKQDAKRLVNGGKYKYAWLGRWNYATEDDDICVEEFYPD